MAAPCDLCMNIFDLDTNEILRCLKTAINLGYEAVAINRHVKSLKNFNRKTEDRLSNDALTKLKEEISSFSQKCSPRQKLRVYTRITVVVDDDTSNHKMFDKSFSIYDIVAVQPTTEKSMKGACNNLPADVISIDFTEKLPFPIKHGSISAARQRGLYFEIQYSPMIRDDTARRNILIYANELAHLTRGKNIVMTSGCANMMDLRGPLDVANLTHLFAMSQENGKASVTTACRNILSHAESRRSIKSVVTVEKLSDVDDKGLAEALESDHDDESTVKVVRSSKKQKRIGEREDDDVTQKKKKLCEPRTNTESVC